VKSKSLPRHEGARDRWSDSGQAPSSHAFLSRQGGPGCRHRSCSIRALRRGEVAALDLKDLDIALVMDTTLIDDDALSDFAGEVAKVVSEALEE
jgi:hypothetical protein